MQIMFNPKHRILSTFFVSIILVSQSLYADKVSINETKSKLRQVDEQIKKLQTSLGQAKDKKTLLQKELSTIEKKIGTQAQKSFQIRQALSKIKGRIKQLEKDIKQQTHHLKTQQSALASHIRARYKMGAYQPLTWLINQENPHQISHLLTLYQYLIKAHQNLITKVKSIQQELLLKNKALKKEYEQKASLKQTLEKQLQQLEENKTYQHAILQSLNQEIQSQQQTLQEYQRNKTHLSHLMDSLMQNSMKKPTHSFAKMRHKLPTPLSISKKQAKPLNQGLLFLTQEGTPVESIYPGKVVFSDWLKGYGLILILDHGDGYMTLYAHNQSVFKQSGDEVLQGETISLVGHSGGLKENGLYFEVRHRGKALPPLEWLS